MRLNLDDIDQFEVQLAIAVRRPGRWGEPVILDELIVVGNNVKVYFYDRLSEKLNFIQSLADWKEKNGIICFKPFDPRICEEIPLNEFKQIKRFVNLNKLLND